MFPLFPVFEDDEPLEELLEELLEDELLEDELLEDDELVDDDPVEDELLVGLTTDEAPCGAKYSVRCLKNGL